MSQIIILIIIISGNADMVRQLGSMSDKEGKNNISFISFFLLGDLDKCLDILIQTDRLPEAAFFARYTIRFYN